MVMETGCLSQAALRDELDPAVTVPCPLILKEDFVQVDS